MTKFAYFFSLTSFNRTKLPTLNPQQLMCRQHSHLDTFDDELNIVPRYLYKVLSIFALAKIFYSIWLYRYDLST